MRLTTFIYALCEPGTRTVRYIGKSDNPKKRFSKHISEANKLGSHKNCWIYSLAVSGKCPVLITLSEIPTMNWKEEEACYIAAARCLGMALTNSTEGGDGGAMTEEIRSKIRVSLTGKKHTEERRAKSGINNRGKIPWNKGKKATAEARANQSAAHLGKKYPPRSEEHCAALRAVQLGKVQSPEARAKNSEAQKLAWARRKAAAETGNPS